MLAIEKVQWSIMINLSLVLSFIFVTSKPLLNPFEKDNPSWLFWKVKSPTNPYAALAICFLHKTGDWRWIQRCSTTVCWTKSWLARGPGDQKNIQKIQKAEITNKPYCVKHVHVQKHDVKALDNNGVTRLQASFVHQLMTEVSPRWWTLFRWLRLLEGPGVGKRVIVI